MSALPRRWSAMNDQKIVRERVGGTQAGWGA
jgi:hypothetical protein